MAVNAKARTNSSSPRGGYKDSLQTTRCSWLESSSLTASYHSMYDPTKLAPLRDYKYRAVDKSFISRYILSHYWNWAVNIIPLWMAPNLVTLVGFLFMIIAMAVMCIWIPDLVGPGPSWTYFLFAACFWIYSTMDNLDGKQARRTGSSSPLGELFDHGIDALNCTPGALIQAASMAFGHANGDTKQGCRTILLMLMTYWGFYIPTWENYFTGQMYLGYINGPTEGLLLAMIAMIISGIYGPQIWMKDNVLPSMIINRASFVKKFSLGDVIVSSLLFFIISVYIPQSIYTVNRACKQSGQSFKFALSRLLAMPIATLAALVWLYSPNSHIRKEPALFIAFWWAFGISFGKMATKIIHAHLLHRRHPRFTGLFIPLIIAASIMNVPTRYLYFFGTQFYADRLEKLFVWGWLIIAIIGYANWSYHVIQSFCSFLGIYCFSILRRARATTTNLTLTDHLGSPFPGKRKKQ